MRLRHYHLLLVATICVPLPVYAQSAGATSNPPVATAEQTDTWHGRIGLGVNAVISGNDALPNAHTGFGASISAFIQLTQRISTGLAFDWDRYTFDSKNHGDPPGTAARYTDGALTEARVMELVQWDTIKRSADSTNTILSQLPNRLIIGPTDFA